MSAYRMRRLKLGGGVTPPLAPHARAELAMIARGPVPASTVNPGVRQRLLGDALVEEVDLPSPFPAHQGDKVAHLRATEAGKAASRG